MRILFMFSVIGTIATLMASCGGNDCVEGETGCMQGDGGSGIDGGQSGTAPVISDLAYSPDKAAVGTQTTINGTIKFTDAEGDVDKIGIELKLPDGTTQTLPSSAVQGAAGIKAGQAAFIIVLMPPTAGQYTFEIWLADTAGNASNRLSGTVAAE